MTVKMKPSGVEGFGDIPFDWEVNRMSFTFSFGKGLSITKEDLQDEGIPSITYGDIHSRFGFEIDPEVNEVRCVDPKYIKLGRNSLLQFGDFIFADTSEDIAGSGNFTHLNSHALAFAGYHTITARAKRTLNFRYMAYLFDSEPFRNQIRNSVSGVKVFSVTQAIIKNTKLLLPPLPEQQTIAAFLDDRCGQIDGIVADLERQVEILRQCKKALITETVTKGLDKTAPMKPASFDVAVQMPTHWLKTKVKYLCNMQSGTAITSEEIRDEGDYPVYGGNGQRGYYEKFNTEGEYVLVGRQGALCGNVHFVKGQFWASDHAVVTYPYLNVINKFLYYLFIALNFNQYSTAAAQPGLAVATIQRVSVAIPEDKNEQQAIVDYLDRKCTETDDIIAEKQKAAETMRQYKKSLIYEYVTGKKRVAG